MGPLANEAKDLDRIFSTVIAPSEVGIKEIEQLLPLCWKVDTHCSNACEFANEMVVRIKKATTAIDT
jgi:hypothetical protein